LNPKQKRTRRAVALTILVLVVGGLVYAALQAHGTNPDEAKIGDCMAHGDGDDIKIVSCTGSSAAFKVVGKVENKTQPQFDLDSASICKPFPTAKTAFWKGEIGKAGYVLCLSPIQ
jgi:hypothetical protein